MKRFILIVFFQISYFSLLYANVYKFDRYTIKQGLSSDHIYDMVQDEKGFIWISTHNGLIKFDGYDCEEVIPANSAVPIKDRIFKMAHRNDTLWLGTKNGLRSLCLKSLRLDSLGKDENQISSLYTGQNKIWAGLAGGQVLELNNSSSKLQKIPIPTDVTKAIFSFYKCKNGDMLATSGNVLLQIPGNGGKTEVLRKLSGRILLFDLGQQGVWLSAGNQVYRIIETLQGVQFLKGKMNLEASSIHSMATGPNGDIWLGSDMGLHKLEIKNLNQITVRSIPLWKNMPDARTKVRKVFSDRSGTLWVASFDKGLFKMNTQESKTAIFHTLSNNNPETNDISVIQKNKDGKLLLGTRRGGLLLWDKGKIIKHLRRNRKNQRISPLQDNVIRFISPNSKGGFDIGTISSVFEADHEANVLRYLRNANKKLKHKAFTDARCLLVDKAGEKWTGSSNGMFRLDRRDSIIPFGKRPTQTSEMTVTGMIEDDKGQIWATTEEQGLLRLSKNRRHLKRFHNGNNSLSTNITHDIHAGKNGLLFIATANGLNVITQNDKFHHIGKEEGLPHTLIQSVLQDDIGNVWMGTNSGLLMLKAKDLHKVLRGNQKVYFQSFLSRYSFSISTAFKDTQNGKLYFGGPEGFAEISPENLSENTKVLQPVITTTEIFNRPKRFAKGRTIEYSDTLILDHEDNFLKLKFTSPNNNNPENNQFSYKLSPVQTKWIRTDATNRYAVFNALSPGTYKFMVHASNEQNVWTTSPETLTVIIRPPFWQTTWFYLTITFLAVLVAFALFRLRVRNLKNRNRELEAKVEAKVKHIKKQQEEILEQKESIIEMSQKIHEADMEKLRHYTNISHEFKTPLMLITSPLDRILETEKHLPKHITQSLRVMRRNCYTLLLLINQLMEIRKKDTGKLNLRISECDINTLVRNVAECFNPILKEKNITLTVPPQDITEGYLDVRKIEKVIFNILSNAFKFTPENGEIQINLDIKNGKAIIKISDTGSGIPEQEKTRIFERFYKSANPQNHLGSGIGLSLAKEYLKLHKGEITIEDNSPQGSVFIIEIPIQKNDYSPEQIVDATEAGENDYRYFDEGVNLIRKVEEPVQITPMGKDVSQVILVVEDNHDLRFHIKNTLMEAGYQVLEAKNGKEAVDITAKHLPDLIISDLMMPEMDGMELCEIMKKQLLTCHIPFLILTAKTEENAQLEGLLHGADDYITKPFNLNILLAKIRSTLQNRETLRKRFADKKESQLIDDNIPKKDQTLINSLAEYIRVNISDPDLSVELLAKEMGMSRSNLYRKVKELTGISASEFIRNYRLKVGAELILKKEMNISEISYQVGFESVTSFRRIFKKYYGCTPSTYGKGSN
ncbi:hybrid sensor histidine kinase/response regulator [Fulvitalea axinellae]|uniref:histidine kinase n=1 Tax=Fulvitalea axinellae TaxID=1182444 RepID=A0AAU9CND7_9BACT|nr:hybrid sensor histidine kinase/response regulator [Fulvitalea axinellae]